MIAVDASAICAILLREPEGAAFQAKLSRVERSFISPINYWEAKVSLTRRGDADAERHIERLCARVDIMIAAIDGLEADEAFRAWTRFGKGRHPAQLNLGDCFAYALAKSRDLPLLFKGGDFTMTDIRSAL